MNVCISIINTYINVLIILSIINTYKGSNKIVQDEWIPEISLPYNQYQAIFSVKGRKYVSWHYWQ